MSGAIEFYLLCFTSLFTMINPIGVIPLYLGLTSEMEDNRTWQVAVKASLTSLLILLLFAFTGKAIFDFFSITTDSLKIVGGVLFFIMGFDMLQARAVRHRQLNESEGQFAADVAITPLAIPMICGPGAITMVILLMQEAQDPLSKGLFLGALITVMLATLGILLAGKGIRTRLGENGNKVLMRLMGLIVMVIAVEFFFSGLEPKIRAILTQV